MKKIVFDISEGVSADKLLAALTAAMDAAQIEVEKATFRLSEGIKVRTPHAAEGATVGRNAEVVFPANFFKPDEFVGERRLESFLTENVSGEKEKQLAAKLTESAFDALDATRPSSRRTGAAFAQGITMRSAAVIAAFLQRLGELDAYSLAYVSKKKLHVVSPAAAMIADALALATDSSSKEENMLEYDGAALLSGLGFEKLDEIPEGACGVGIGENKNILRAWILDDGVKMPKAEQPAAMPAPVSAAEPVSAASAEDSTLRHLTAAVPVSCGGAERICAELAGQALDAWYEVSAFTVRIHVICDAENAKPCAEILRGSGAQHVFAVACEEI